nr:T9SS type A sorting domain-containing protein [uncultured Fluviicola sp.]
MNYPLNLVLFFLLLSVPIHAQVLSPAIKLTASSRHVNDAYGNTVSKDGDFAAVGSVYDDNLGEDAGTVYIYKNQPDGTWQETQILTASDGMAGDYFGRYVALSGNYLLVGSSYADVLGVNNSVIENAGAVYVFEKNQNDIWIEVVKLTAIDPHTDDNFAEVALYGRYAVVGASYNSYDTAGSNFILNAGAAYIFERTDGGQWLQLQKITASDRSHGAHFSRVAIYNHQLVVGAYGANTNAENQDPLYNAGAVYFFERNLSGTWEEIQKLTPSQRHANDAFGQSVAISANHILTGAHLEADDLNGNNLLTDAGAAYLFERNTNNDWIQIQKMSAPDRQQQDIFGYSVALDGSYALVGSLYNNLNATGGNSMDNAGAAYLYENNGNTNWTFIQKIVAPDRSPYDNFSISLEMEGATILIGATTEDEDSNGQNTLQSAGSAYFFEIVNPLGIEEQKDLLVLIYPNPTEGLIHIASTVLSGSMTVKLKDISGKQLDETNYSSLENIDYQIKQPAGIYFIEINSEQATVIKKVVIR